LDYWALYFPGEESDKMIKRQMNYKKVSAVICVLVLLSAVICAFASAGYEEKIREYDKKIQEREQETTRIEKDLTNKKRELEAKRAREKNLRTTLGRINRDLQGKKREIIVYDDNLEKTRKNLDRKKEGLEHAISALEISQDTLRERLLLIYKRPQPAYPYDFPQGLLRAKSMNIVASSGADELTRNREKKEKVEQEKESLEERKARITDYKAAALAKKSQIEKNKKQKEEDLAQAKKERISYEKRVAQLKKASRELQKLLNDLEAKKKETVEQARLASLAFRQKQRRLPWPTLSHQITKAYGKHQHPQYKTYTFHKGIDIKAPQGAEVCVVSQGTVVFAAWSQQPGLRDYGKLVMIAHGGGYYTLYAHLDSIVVQEKQEVTGGQKIGTVGQTASKKGPYLYFEIRKDGAPLNPSKWLRK
jgi:murein DD-endopeptidase MepM/ murein hydrolase activator NlpD